MSENKYPIGGYAPGEEKYIKASDITELMHIQPGHKIKIYGEERTVTGFYGQYNEGLEKWETIILTEGRGDPFERTIGDIEVLPDQPFNWQPKPAGAVWVKGAPKEQRQHFARVPSIIEDNVIYDAVIWPTSNPDYWWAIGHGFKFSIHKDKIIEYLDESGTASNKDDEWIDVNDRLPEEAGRYWCYVEEITDLGRGYFQWNCAYNQNGKFFTDKSLCNGERITHWQPLPAPPKIKQEGRYP